MELELEKWITPTGADAGADESYLLRVLTGLESQAYIAHIRERLDAGDHVLKIEAPPAIAKGMLIAALRDWTGVTAGGEPAECTDELKVRLPYKRMNWIMSEIIRMSFATPDTEKNLSSRSKSQRARESSTVKPARGAGTATKRTPRKNR